jgi:hypothetical protein
MAAEAITGRIRPAPAASGRVALVAAGVTVAMFGEPAHLSVWIREGQDGLQGSVSESETASGGRA